MKVGANPAGKALMYFPRLFWVFLRIEKSNQRVFFVPPDSYEVRTCKVLFSFLCFQLTAITNYTDNISSSNFCFTKHNEEKFYPKTEEFFWLHAFNMWKQSLGLIKFLIDNWRSVFVQEFAVWIFMNLLWKFYFCFYYGGDEAKTTF